nr:MAG: polyprotein 1 [Picornavirales sp.]
MMNTITTATTTQICVLKSNAKLPQVLAHIRWAVNELENYESAFKFIFPRALYKHFFNTRKIDKQQLKRLIRERDVMQFLLKEVDCHFNNVEILVKMHSYCDSRLTEKEARKLIRGLFPPTAKELGGIGHKSVLQSFLNVGLDDEVLDTIESLQDTITSRIPTTVQQVDMLQQICQASAGVSGSFDGLNETLGTLIDAFTKTATKVNDFTEGAKKTVAEFNIIPKLMASSAVAFAAYTLSKEVTKTNIALATIAVGYAVYTVGIDNIKELFVSCGTHIFGLISKILGGFSSEPESVVQGAFDDFDFLTSMFSSWPKSTIASLTSLMRLSKDLPGFLTGLLDIIKDALDAGTNNYFGFNTMNSMFTATDALNVKYSAILKEYEQRKLLVNIENSVRLDFLIKEYEKVLLKLDNKQKINLSRLISTKLAVLRKIQSHFHVFMAVDKSFRQEPSTICIKGPPGIFKTELSAQLVDIILRISLSKDEVDNSERHNLVYERKSTQEFWSNYPPTCEVITMDDFGQQRESVGSTTSCYLDLIYIYNTAPFMLNCATLEEKGNVFCNAKWVVMTTNCEEFKPYSLVDKRAVDRRIDFMIQPVPKAKYADDRDINILDPSKIRTEIEGVLDITLDKYDYIIVRNGKKETRAYYNFNQMVDALFSLHSTKTHRFRQNAKRRAKMVDVVRTQLQHRSDMIKTHEEYVKNHAIKVQSALPVKEEAELANNFDIFDSMDKAFMEEMDDVTEFMKKDVKMEVNFSYIHSDKRLELRVDNVINLLRMAAVINGGDSNITNEEIIDCFGNIEKVVSSRAHKILLQHIDEQWLMFYTLCFHLYTMEYRVLSHEDVHPLFAGMSPFVFFLLLANKKSEFGEYLFRGYEFKQCEIEDITLIVSFDVPMYDSIKDFIVKKGVSLLEYIATLPKFVQLLFTFSVGYISFQAHYTLLKGVIVMFKSAFDFLLRLIAGSEMQSAQPRFSKLAKQDRINLRDLVKTQGGDTSGYDMAKKFSHTNTSSFTIEYRAEGHRDSFKVFDIGSALWLDSTTLLLPEHYITHPIASYGQTYDQLSNIWVSLCDHDGSVMYEEPMLTLIRRVYHTYEGDTHLAFWRLKKPLGQLRKDIKSYFVSDADVHALSNDDLNVTMCLNSDNKAFQNSSAIVTSVAVADLKLAKGLEYQIDTGKGDCGMPLIVRSARLGKRRIIGVHVAGTDKGYSSRYAWSALVTQEMLSKALKNLEESIKDFEKDLEDTREELGVELQSNFDLPTSVPYVHSPYKKSKIVPSVLMPVMGPSTKQPAMLMRQGTVDPYKVARANYYKRETCYDKDNMRKAIDDMHDTIAGIPWDLDAELLTVEEALYGSSTNPLYSAIPSGTSAGAPIKYEEPHLKASLLGPDALRSRANPNFAPFEEDIMDRIDAANRGVRQRYYYTDNLKDTLVTVQKAAKGEGRLFSGSCMRLCVATKSAFGKFIEFLAKDSIEKGFATTLNPYSADWHKVAYTMSRFSPSISQCLVLCIDYSKFDACHTVDTMEEALEVINQWYVNHGFSEYELARKTLYKELTNSLHLVFDKIEQWDGSLPSGSILTLLVNGIINQLNLRYCYYTLVPSEITDNHSFKQLIESIVQGDDVLLAVHDKIKPYFTEEGIIKCMSDRGYVVTSDDKSKPIGFRLLSEATFLKRGFNIEHGVVHGNLALSTILNTPLWSKDGDYYKKITKDSIEFFFRELSLHPEDIFEQYAPKMRLAISAAKLKDIQGLTWNHAKWRTHVYNTEPFTMDL